MFFGDKNLSRITIASKKLTVAGKEIFTGDSAKLVVRVPKTKVAEYTKLLSGKGLSRTAVIKKMPRSK